MYLCLMLQWVYELINYCMTVTVACQLSGLNEYLRQIESNQVELLRQQNWFPWSCMPATGWKTKLTVKQPGGSEVDFKIQPHIPSLSLGYKMWSPNSTSSFCVCFLTPSFCFTVQEQPDREIPFCSHRGTRVAAFRKAHSGFLFPPVHFLLVDWPDGEG